MIENHFPEFFRRADDHSARWQRRYLRMQKVQLGALLLAAAVAAVGDYPLPVLLFGVAIAAQLYRLTARADEKWWNGRAGAESAKTASWLYVVGGAPFNINNPNADLELARRLREIGDKVARILPVPTGQAHVTAEMVAVRTQPLPERVEIYQRERIQDQCQWYAKNSELNEKGGRWSAFLGVAMQTLGLLFGVAAAVYHWRLDAVGLFASLAASAVAWSAVKQYETLERSYAVASSELSTIEVEISSRSWTDESAWAAFVNASEDAISREHTSWRASRAA